MLYVWVCEENMGVQKEVWQSGNLSFFQLLSIYTTTFPDLTFENYEAHVVPMWLLQYT